jgi:hypothetical protein
VPRPAAIAHGDGICAAHVAAPIRKTTISTAADTNDN